MLINVFGDWINPDNITNLKNYEYYSLILFTGNNSVEVRSKTVDEVAEEINRQLSQQHTETRNAYLGTQFKELKLDKPLKTAKK